jgi:hypothetical protein
MNDPVLGEVPNTSVLVGSNATVMIDDKVAAYVDDIDIDENYNQTEIMAIGDFFPKDMKPIKFDGSLSGKMWIITDDADEGSVKSLPDLTNILVHQGNLFEFREKSTGKVILRAICKLNTNKTNIGSSAPSSRNVSFKIARVQHGPAYN